MFWGKKKQKFVSLDTSRLGELLNMMRIALPNNAVPVSVFFFQASEMLALALEGLSVRAKLRFTQATLLEARLLQLALLDYSMVCNRHDDESRSELLPLLCDLAILEFKSDGEEYKPMYEICQERLYSYAQHIVSEKGDFNHCFVQHWLASQDGTFKSANGRPLYVGDFIVNNAVLSLTIKAAGLFWDIANVFSTGTTDLRQLEPAEVQRRSERAIMIGAAKIERASQSS